MAAHEDITDKNCHTIDLSSYASTARGVDGPKDVKLCLVYAPADSTCYIQTGAVTDGTTDISTDGAPIPAGQWLGWPCGVNDASGPEVRRPSVYVQGDDDVRVRFVTDGVG